MSSSNLCRRAALRVPSGRRAIPYFDFAGRDDRGDECLVHGAREPKPHAVRRCRTHQFGHDVRVQYDHGSNLGGVRSRSRRGCSRSTPCSSPKSRCVVDHKSGPLTPPSARRRMMRASSSIEWPQVAARTLSLSLSSSSRFRIVILAIDRRSSSTRIHATG